MIDGLLDGLKEPFALGEAYERALSSGYAGRLEAFRMRFLRQVKAGRPLRVARNRHIADSSGLVWYSWDYSDEARNIVSEICAKTSDYQMDGAIVLLDMPTEAPGCSRFQWQCAIEEPSKT